MTVTIVLVAVVILIKLLREVKNMHHRIKAEISKIVTKTRNKFDSDTWVAIGIASVILVSVFAAAVII